MYAHRSTEFYIDRMASIIRPVIARRSARMFGGHLPRHGPDAMVNAGIGPHLELGPGGGTIGLIRPNQVFDEELEVELCGVPLEELIAELGLPESVSATTVLRDVKTQVPDFEVSRVREVVAAPQK